MRNTLKCSWHGIAVLALGMTLTSCSNSPQRIVAETRDVLNGQLDRLDDIAAKAAGPIKLASDTLALPADGPALDLGGVSYGCEGSARYYQRGANAQLFSLTELSKPPDADPATTDMFGARELVWKQVRGMVKQGTFPKDKQDAVAALKAVPQWRYIVVLTIRAAQRPQANPGYTGGNVTETRSFSTGTFAAGFVEGDALLFDLNDGSLLGGFPVSAKSSGNVESTSYGGDANAAMQRALDNDLLHEIRTAIGRGIRQRVPADRIQPPSDGR